VLPQWRASTYKGLHVRPVNSNGSNLRSELLLLLDLLPLLSKKVF
jgi:hypothetical protein